MNIAKSQRVLLLSSALIALPLGLGKLNASEEVAFAGQISQIQGKRAEIELENGGSVWISLKNGIAGLAIGDHINGSYRAVGDTLLAEEVSFQ